MTCNTFYDDGLAKSVDPIIFQCDYIEIVVKVHSCFPSSDAGADKETRAQTVEVTEGVGFVE